MSKPRYDWWGYVKGMIRRYPLLKAEYEDMLDMHITPSYSEERRGNETSRTVENITTKVSKSGTAKEYHAVHKAIEMTRAHRDGDKRLELIDLVFWKKTHTLQGAAMTCYISYDTAVKWHGELIRLVAWYFGLME